MSETPTFQEKVSAKLESIGITLGKIEADNPESLVYHIPNSQNQVIAEKKTELEAELNAIVEQTDMFGMNVVIVESKDLE